MAAAQEHGTVKLYHQDADNGFNSRLFELNTRNFRLGPSETKDTFAIDQQPHLEDTGITAVPNDKLILQFIADAADTVESEECVILIPIRKRNLRTGKVSVGYLTGADFVNGATTLGPAGTADVACAAGAETVLGTYTVPEGVVVRVGNPNPINGRMFIYLGDDTA